jgi:hypothetical protein
MRPAYQKRCTRMRGTEDGIDTWIGSCACGAICYRLSALWSCRSTSCRNRLRLEFTLQENAGLSFNMIQAAGILVAILSVQGPEDLLRRQGQVKNPHTAGVRHGVGDCRRGRYVGVFRDSFAAERRRTRGAFDQNSF